jgi:tetraacyldisaccharide 4'-kinase
MAARAWEEIVRVRRPLVSSVPVLCVGGATLGGSGRTPLAIACALSLASRLRVVLVSHAYGARAPKEPHVVLATDDVRVVGDEALECARAGLKVVVARERQRALDAAAATAHVIVLDGPLQLTPRPATLSLLAACAEEPWGSGACPPVGDMRAPRKALEEATDCVVTIGLTGMVAARSDGAWRGRELVSIEELRGTPLGLATGIARPWRVEAFLRQLGIVPRRVVRVANHAPLELRHDDAIQLWLVTGKDAGRVCGDAAATGQTAVIDYHLDLPPELQDLLASCF